MAINRAHNHGGPRTGSKPGGGLVIDQDGREVGAAPFDGQAFHFQFGNAGANPFAPLTREQRIARLEALAKLLDVAFVVPGTNIRYGIDGIIGLVPVIGDIVTTAISLWLVREAKAIGAPWHVTTRMLAMSRLTVLSGLSRWRATHSM
jgi:hypothetical protein